MRQGSVQSQEDVQNEQGLVEALKRGDVKAFEAFVLTYQHRVFGISLRMLGDRSEAEEIAQEAFLRVYRSIREFRGESKLSTWLYTITSRLCLNRLKSGERQRREGAGVLARIANGHPDPAETLEESELEAAIRQAIAELDEDRRIVVVLRDLHGLSYEEIAEALDLELGTVRSRLHRARMELKQRLERFTQ
ncbi:MAG TPA: sigma-70 family RNA polymerase sigma factor [Methylomirabilota bacterium]|nr:sigma-70 family RNA polymerase sigma factor [Methylomirabilota bacterium]